MRTNLTKQKLAEGKAVFGGIIASHASDQVELLGAIGYDFVMIDAEHGPMSLTEIEDMVRAAEIFGITPLVRVVDHSAETILRVLDRGVQGIIVPHVNTRAEAEAVARAARYYPEGNRGVGSGRAHDYGVSLSRAESTKLINANILVVAMCEEVEAIDNLDEILQVPGIDVVHVASSDLTQSMGYPPASEVRDVMTKVVERVRAGGKAAGVGGNSPYEPDSAAAFINAGANFITIQALSLLRIGAETYRKNVDAALTAPKV